MSWVAAHPQSAGKVRRFARYMPTTLKLLRTYDVKGQQSDVASGIRQDIGGILGTLNTAFDNLQSGPAERHRAGRFQRDQRHADHAGAGRPVGRKFYLQGVICV